MAVSETVPVTHIGLLLPTVAVGLSKIVTVLENGVSAVQPVALLK